jgi:hypothetical protein
MSRVPRPIKMSRGKEITFKLTDLPAHLVAVVFAFYSATRAMTKSGCCFLIVCKWPGPLFFPRTLNTEWLVRLRRSAWLRRYLSAAFVKKIAHDRAHCHPGEPFAMRNSNGFLGWLNALNPETCLLPRVEAFQAPDVRRLLADSPSLTLLNISHSLIITLPTLRVQTLTSLDVSNCIGFKQAARTGAACPNLTNLNVSHCPHVTWDDLSQFKCLTDLMANGIEFRQEPTQKLPESLLRVSLDGSNINNNYAEFIGEVNGLSLHRCFDVVGGIPCGSFLRFIARDLIDLDITLCETVTDEAIVAVANRCLNLKALAYGPQACGRSHLTNVGVQALRRCVHLEELTLFGPNRITHTPLKTCHRLKILRLFGNDQFIWKGMRYFNAETLILLDQMDASWFSYDGVNILPGNCVFQSLKVNLATQEYPHFIYRMQTDFRVTAEGILSPASTVSEPAGKDGKYLKQIGNPLVGE